LKIKEDNINDIVSKSNTPVNFIEVISKFINILKDDVPVQGGYPKMKKNTAESLRRSIDKLKFKDKDQCNFTKMLLKHLYGQMELINEITKGFNVEKNVKPIVEKAKRSAPIDDEAEEIKKKKHRIKLIN